MPLTPTQKKAFRDELKEFSLLGEKYNYRWDYSMRRPFTGLGIAPQTYHRNDCSGYLGIAYYWAARHARVSVRDPLGYTYTGWGNTGSCYTYMKMFRAPEDKYLIGDVALYLQGPSDHHHVMFCRKAGTGATAIFTSFGSQSGPQEHGLHYRSDLTGVYRHPALR